MSQLPAVSKQTTYNTHAVAQDWASYCDVSLAFDSPGLIDMLEIWRGAAGKRTMPQRNDLTARLIKCHLPHIVIYERFEGATGKPRYRVRLMGTAFAQVYGDLTGKIIDEAVPQAMVPRFHLAIGETLVAQQPLRFLSRVDMQEKSYFVAEYLMVPLANDEGTPTMVLSRAHFSASKMWNEIARDLAAGRVPSLKG